jgi:hypothetical protein
METAKGVYVDQSGVGDTAELEEWCRSLLVSAAEARMDLARRRRVHRARLSIALVAVMVAVMSVTIGVARHPDLLATFGLAIRDMAKVALGFIWFCGGLLTWVSTRR